MKHSISPPHRYPSGEQDAVQLQAGRFYDAENGERVGPLHTVSGKRFWIRADGLADSPEWSSDGTVRNAHLFPNPYGNLIRLSADQLTKRPSATISALPRYECGEIYKELQEPKEGSPEKTFAAAMFQRKKYGATIKTVCDPIFSDHTLLTMRRWALDAMTDSEGISAIQYQALYLYCSTLGQFLRATGVNVGRVKSPDYIFAGRGGGESCAKEVDPERIDELEREWRSARSALLSYPPNGGSWLSAVNDLAAQNYHGREYEGYWRKKLPEVRSAANVLVRHYGLDRRG